MNERELLQYLSKKFPKEDESVEWKDWKTLKQNISGRSGEDAISYISAISNMEGGFLVIGVSDAFKIKGIEDIETYTAENVKGRILGHCFNLPSEGFDVIEYITNDTHKRVWLIKIPRHTPRCPVIAHDTAWQRLGDSLVIMRPERKEAIINESTSSYDWSAEICEGVYTGDFDSNAILELKARWAEKSKREDFLTFNDEKVLRNLNLINDDGVTNAALILLGKTSSLIRLLPCSEVIFEWRQDDTRVAHDFRANWRNAFLLIYDEIWTTVDARNLRIPFQEGLIQREVFAFHEKSIREALLNAVAHRDYTKIEQSIFIKASPNAFHIESPGGLPSGVTLDNILIAHVWRNRLLMEVMEKIGLVERSGQGMDDIFSYTIADGKGLPDLTKSDENTVRLTIPASISDPGFVRFLEQIVNEKQVNLSLENLFDLERIRTGNKPQNQNQIENWLQLGIIEKVGKTSGMRYILSHRYYKQEKRLGEHTRLTGLSRDAKKALIIDHIKRNGKGSMDEFIEAFLDIKRTDITNLLQELRREHKIKHLGSTRGGYWVLS